MKKINLTEATILALEGKLNNKDFNNENKLLNLSNKEIKTIVNFMIDYDFGYEEVGGAYGPVIYEKIKEFWSDKFYIKTFNKKYPKINLTSINFNNKEEIKPIALALIKAVCLEQGWSVPLTKKECGY